MIRFDAEQAKAKLIADCQAALPRLDSRLGEWLRSHCIPPRPIVLSRKTDGGNSESFWLVTDHNGRDDASFRVVYDDESGRYGIECTIQNNVCLFAGYRASLVDTVTDIKGDGR
jgi:hypothetical protein